MSEKIKSDTASPALSDADVRLWRQITAQTQPLPLARQENQALPPARQKEQITSASLVERSLWKREENKEGERKEKKIAKNAAAPGTAHARVLPQVSPRTASLIPSGGKAHPPQSDIAARTRRKLHRGQIALDDQLDLHGLTVEQAQYALGRFINAAVSRGDRWLLIITGKGADGQGVLRCQLPVWCRQPPMADHIVEFAPAARAHGGDGAYYLRLRRRI